MSKIFQLSKPKLNGEFALEKAIHSRRTRREFSGRTLLFEEISQILWAAGGISDIENGYHNYPSAGSFFPLEFHLITEQVEGIENGIYSLKDRNLHLRRTGNFAAEVEALCFNHDWLHKSAAMVFISAVFSRTTDNYGPDSKKFVYMDMGHAAQNIYLQSESLGLASAEIGAFAAPALGEFLQLPSDEELLIFFALGGRKI